MSVIANCIEFDCHSSVFGCRDIFFFLLYEKKTLDVFSRSLRAIIVLS